MAEPLDPADFYDLTTITDVAVSPSGDRVAFTADEFDPEADDRHSSLFVVPSDGSRSPHRLTGASDAGQPKWSPDGDRLAFVAAREEDLARKVGREGDEDEQTDGEAGDETHDDEDDESDEDESGGTAGGGDEPKPQVWVFDLALGGDARQVTDREEGVGQFDWGPDGERLCYASRDPTEEQQEYLEEKRDGGPIEVKRLQHKVEGVGFTDEVTTYLFVTDLESGEERRLDDAYAQGARAPIFGLQPAWAPGERIAFCSNRTETPDDDGSLHLYTIDPDGSDLRQVTSGDFRAYGFAWEPDGDRIAFVGGDPDNWYKPAEIYVARDEPEAYESVSASLDRTAGLFAAPVWLDGSILCMIGDEGLTRLARLDPDEDDPERVFDAQGRDRTVHWLDADGGTVAMSLSHPSAGHDLYAVDVADLDAASDDVLTRLTGVNEDLLSDAALPVCRRVTWENADGVEIEGMLYLPEDHEDERPLPVIAKIHGGPMSYDAPEFSFNSSYWTGQGYAVFRPNYRGSVSYGQEFAEALMGTRGDLETEDVVSGVDYLVEEGIADGDRAFVTGFSYGGITTANVVTRSDRFAAAGAEHGIYDFRSTFGTDDNHLWHEWEFGLPWEVPETYDEISAITAVGQVDTPLLVTAGENDWRCPPTQAEQLYVSVRKQGVPAKLVIYQNEHHDVGDPDRAIHRIETLTGWFEEHDPEDEIEDENEE